MDPVAAAMSRKDPWSSRMMAGCGLALGVHRYCVIEHQTILFAYRVCNTLQTKILSAGSFFVSFSSRKDTRISEDGTHSVVGGCFAFCVGILCFKTFCVGL
jgi:hypothetical protein